MDIATAGDAAWFDRHNDRRLRIRNLVAGEFGDVSGLPPVGMAWRTIVLEAQPGARSRQAIALPLDLDIDTLDDTDLFDLFVQVALPGARATIASLRKIKITGSSDRTGQRQNA
ncbi:MAG: hypothetical protein EOP67_00675 [Sphingomonas sp.]|nr:MAG: hypothetical protein EOP67_00675 [Sphingomonas sp.]